MISWTQEPIGAHALFIGWSSTTSGIESIVAPPSLVEKILFVCYRRNLDEPSIKILKLQVKDLESGLDVG